MPDLLSAAVMKMPTIMRNTSAMARADPSSPVRRRCLEAIGSRLEATNVRVIARGVVEVLRKACGHRGRPGTAGSTRCTTKRCRLQTVHNRVLRNHGAPALVGPLDHATVGVKAV